MAQKKLFMFAGEMSGDMHGASLVKALKQRDGEITFTGVAGQEMRAQGVTGIWRTEDFGKMGFSDVLFALPTLVHKFLKIKEKILEIQPEAVVFIDSSSFSIRMAKALRKKGFSGKLIQYICPAVWAWGKSRITQLSTYFDLLLCIYPFEPAYFPPSSLKVEYVGNPVKELTEKHPYEKDWYRLFGMERVDDLIGLFPGSRLGEIQRNLPLQLQAAKEVQKVYPNTTFAISCANNDNIPLMQQLLDKSGLRGKQEVFFIPKSYAYELMSSCRSAIAKSGTVTLELALHQCPTVVMYELSLLNQWVAQYMLGVSLPYYALPNILSQKRIFPECIKHGITSTELSQPLLALHEEGSVRQTCLADMQQLHQILEGSHASEHAAKAIAETVWHSHCTERKKG